MDDQESWEFYNDPENLVPVGPGVRRGGTPEAILRPLYDAFGDVTVSIHRDHFWTVRLRCTHDDRTADVTRHGVGLLSTLRDAAATALAMAHPAVR